MREVISEEKPVPLSGVTEVLVEAPQLGVEGGRVFRYSLKVMKPSCIHSMRVIFIS